MPPAPRFACITTRVNSVWHHSFLTVYFLMLRVNKCLEVRSFDATTVEMPIRLMMWSVAEKKPVNLKYRFHYR